MPRISLAICLTALLLSACGNGETDKKAPSATHQNAQQAGSKFAITDHAAGAAELGMTLNEVLAALPDSTSNAEKDGEGIEWMNIAIKDKTVMSVLLNDDHTISLIRVLSPQFVTEQGVSVGENLQSAADKMGGITEIQATEIESREFATFQNMPPYTEFQVEGKDGTAGVYGSQAKVTAVASPSATIHSIWIAED
jgi:hypothetical protein